LEAGTREHAVIRGALSAEAYEFRFAIRASTNFSVCHPEAF